MTQQPAGSVPCLVRPKLLSINVVPCPLFMHRVKVPLWPLARPVG